MKALLYQGKQDIQYAEFEDATIQADTDLIVEMKQCGICGSDLHIYNGHGFSADHGFCVGHEAIGEVAETGKAVRKFKAGDKVMISAGAGCGQCHHCLSGDMSRCTTGAANCYGISAALQGCQAEGIRVPMGDFNVAKIPESVTEDQALMLTDNLPTAYLGCYNADIKAGNTVAIVGLGPIGLMAVEIAFAMGATTVYAIDLVPHRRELATQLGAIALGPEEAPAKIMEETKGQMIECVVEAVGVDTTLSLALQLAGRWGTVSSIGAHQNMDFKFPMGLAFFKGLNFRIGLCSPPQFWHDLIRLIEGDRLHPERFISHRMSLSEGAEAYRKFEAKEDQALKMVLTP